MGNRFDEAVSMADKPSLAFPNSQRCMLNALIETGIPLVVVNMTGSAMDLKWLSQAESVKAILQAWYPGAEEELQWQKLFLVRTILQESFLLHFTGPKMNCRPMKITA